MFLSALGLGVMVGSSWIIVQVVKVQWSAPAHKEEKQVTHKAEPAPSFSYSYELKNISIPLVDRSATRVAYAQFTLLLDCPTKKSRDSMTLHRAKLLDTIFEVASQFYVEDFQTPKGFENFKKKLIASYKKHFEILSPREIAIRDWFMN